MLLGLVLELVLVWTSQGVLVYLSISTSINTTSSISITCDAGT